ncbi:MAG: DUF4124 domain-containing protein [Gammaproteobacteria bacterium]|nr:DUF4124 domain-containing protein [Gammaproteobacteria bacterium]
MNPWQTLVILSALIVMAAPCHAGLHKWVDDQGQVHYGDRVPPKYLRQQRSELNDQGVVIKKVEQGKSDEQLAREKKEREENAEANKQKLIEQRRKALRDRVLLESYTTERDILIQRDARVDAVNSQITLTESIIKDHEKKLADVKQRIQAIEKSGREVPENLHKEIIAVGRQLETHYQYVENKNNERQQIIDKFNDDIERFGELMEARKKK